MPELVVEEVRWIRFAVGVVVAALATGSCTRPNPAYCSENADCRNGQSCDLTTHGCVAAGPDAGGCKLDDECDSRVCRPDGACELPESVLYVATSALSAGTCSVETPCELSYARSLLDGQRTTIRLADGTYSLATAFTITPPILEVTVVGGAGAIIQRSSAGPAMEVRSGASLTLRGITLQRGVDCNTSKLTATRVTFGSPTESRPWITTDNCMTTVSTSELTGATSTAIEALYGGSLTVTSTTISQGQGEGVRAEVGQFWIEKSSITDNKGIGILAQSQFTTVRRCTIAKNRMGGISSAYGVFDVTNNFVFRNGNALDATVGGMRLDTSSPGNRAAHNTVVRNDTMYEPSPTYAGGFYCRGGGTISNNLITNNFLGNADHPQAQVFGSCGFSGNFISSDADALHFVRDLAEPFDYHIGGFASPAVNMGGTLIPPIEEDYDGNARSDYDGNARSDGSPDIGADELPAEARQ